MPTLFFEHTPSSNHKGACMRVIGCLAMIVLTFIAGCARKSQDTNQDTNSSGSQTTLGALRTPPASKELVSCLECSGRGKVFARCSSCKGGGRTTSACLQCKGKGYARTVPSPLRCISCNGSGQQTTHCTECRDRLGEEYGNFSACTRCAGRGHTSE